MYYEAKIVTDMREMECWYYIADSLHYSGQNKYLTSRLRDRLDPQPVIEESAEEIVAHVIESGGLTLKQDAGE